MRSTPRSIPSPISYDDLKAKGCRVNPVVARNATPILIAAGIVTLVGGLVALVFKLASRD